MSEPTQEQESVKISREGYSSWHKMVDFTDTEYGLRVRTACGYFSPPGEAVDFQEEFPPNQDGSRILSSVCEDCHDE